MPSKARPKKTVEKPTPWWLGTGDVVCPHCGQLYHNEREYRCPDCDEPSCRDCKCPECDEQAQREAHSHGG
jgi:hypothetical protein